ncbi:MAG: hypothetical protein LBQ90_01160 [Synergistaceae bacterium]|jgi:hypothetical protein|nr:hypothetical protein [Synergistaceae bacterium]
MALVLAGTLTGAIGVGVALLRREESPETEARRLARWLTNVITTANRTGRAFTLSCPGNGPQRTITIDWARDAEQKTYTSRGDCRFIRYQNSNPRSVYSPQWNTFSPAFTIKVTNGRVREDHYVVVSLYGRVRTNKLPPVN